jgi:hypothetical protein
MLFEFSKRLLVLSALAGVLYFVMSYPIVFEKVRKYFPFKFNNTKNMLIFNSVVFALVMYFMGFIILKSLHLEVYEGITTSPTPSSYPRITGEWTGPGKDGEVVTIEISLDTDTPNPPEYNMVVTKGHAGWITGKLQCSGLNLRGCGNLNNYRVNALLSNDDQQNGGNKYWNGGSGTVSNSSIKWDNKTVWNKNEPNEGEMWLARKSEPEVLSDRWVITGVNEMDINCESKPVPNNDGFDSKKDCSDVLKMIRRSPSS